MLGSGRARVSASELSELLTSVEQSHKRKLDELLVDYDLSTKSPQVNLVKGTASKVITSFSQKVEADLIVIGTVGRTGISG